MKTKPLNVKLFTTVKIDPLEMVGLIFRKTALGQAVFTPIGDVDAHNGLFPDHWTVGQLRAIANFMEKNPNCTIFDDGSGSPCK